MPHSWKKSLMKVRATTTMSQVSLSLMIMMRTKEKEEGKTDDDMDSSDDDNEDTRSSKSNIKRHTRTQSLEKATVIPSPKRRTYRGPSLEHVSAAAMDFEAAYIVDSVGETPTTFKSAMESSDSGKWKEACDLEFDSLQRNDTWEIVPLPKGRKAIGCRWVFRVRRIKMAEVERFQGKTCGQRILTEIRADYEETFARWPSSHRFVWCSVWRLSTANATSDGRQDSVS
uniref:Reverse transcriptase Ty1/copia-type domain-containing protein n=1 Tax=Peronospora matthiolae TaxID=2874970 RepID=A0AAV1TVM9_9STRA